MKLMAVAALGTTLAALAAILACLKEINNLPVLIHGLSTAEDYLRGVAPPRPHDGKRRRTGY